MSILSHTSTASSTSLLPKYSSVEASDSGEKGGVVQIDELSARESMSVGVSMDSASKPWSPSGTVDESSLFSSTIHGDLKRVVKLEAEYVGTRGSVARGSRMNDLMVAHVLKIPTTM